MVQFKDIFTGKKASDYGRAVSSQKCMRAGGKHNDLDNVGYTSRHHTFFEMLGNFSFGDYFKDEAIRFAWEFLTRVVGLSPDRLLVTVHSTDDEAAEIWRKVTGFADTKIIRIPTSDNFWSMGDDGPCGPCSEIFYDHGDAIPGGPPGSLSEGDGDRFVEIWNLVFMQFDRTADGNLRPLPRPAIDTGMGLERFTAVLQGVHSNYDIDLFRSLIDEIKGTINVDTPGLIVPYKVIADHIRAISFLIADGSLPSNEGRGYVLRRIIRRALRYGHDIGIDEPFLYKIIPAVTRLMRAAYPELQDTESVAIGVLKNEEDGFMRTIDKGMHILKMEIDKMGSSSELPAEIAYRLYDTYGFPLDMTRDVLRETGKEVNEAAFDTIVSARKHASKGSFEGGFVNDNTERVWYDVEAMIALSGRTSFRREVRSHRSDVIALVQDGRLVNEATDGSEVSIVVASTPFYAESGGQTGDRGKITKDELKDVNEPKRTEIDVLDTVTKRAGLIVHNCRIKVGKIAIGDSVDMTVDWGRRLRTARNHTATHILQRALLEVLGEHVRQKGSLVAADRLRFDFIQHETVTASQQLAIENIVKKVIDEDFEIMIEELPIEKARKTGAIGLFGEKYPEIVRVVTIRHSESGESYSREICGGEHVKTTSQIGCFQILNIGSVGSGIKRIEAATGPGLQEHLQAQIAEKRTLTEGQAEKIKNYEKEISDLRTRAELKDVEIREERVKDVMFRWAVVGNRDKRMALKLIDCEKANGREGYFLVGQRDQRTNRFSVSLFVSRDLVESGVDAREVMRRGFEHLSLNDGRNPDFHIGGRQDLARSALPSSSYSFEELINFIHRVIE
jgi:alanyl-tRNA synthetase